MKKFSLISAHARFMSTMTERRFLFFSIQSVRYAVDLLNVRGVRAYERPEPSAHLPPIFSGTIVFSELIIPVVDLRSATNAERASTDQMSALIFLEEQDRLVALGVDTVNGIGILTEQDLKPRDDLNTMIDNVYVQAVRGMDGHMIVLLDVKAMLKTATVRRHS